MKDRNSRLRIIVLGDIVRIPLGGFAWFHLQYALGFQKLHYDVYFIDDSKDYPSCYDPVRNETGTNAEYGLKFAEAIFRETGLSDRWAYYDAHSCEWRGPCAASMAEVCATADVVLNMAGKSLLRPWILPVPRKVLIDTDPVFTQIAHLTDEEAFRKARAHSSFHSFGENIGHLGCTVPNDGLPWQPTRPPVVLDAWPVTPGSEEAKYTCVMQWESYPPYEYEGRFFGMKSKSFTPFMDLPRRASAQFELAVGSANAPRDTLKAYGWSVIDPRQPTRTPWTYQDYIRQSKAEFGIAKHGYVVTRSGWFSERSANYLASGRPVVVHDTGFTDWLPTGEGVLAFATADEAVAAIEDVNRRYERHCRAAREVAEAYFDYRKVLPALLESAVSQ